MKRHRSLVLAVLIGASTSAYGGDTLEVYAQKCDQAIGLSVPDFICDVGTLVPDTHPNGPTCDRPDQLYQDCDPGSRFHVLANDADRYIVAHCRKRGHALNDGLYGDVAVIQHSKVSGATCFYQGALKQSHDGNVKAPSKGVGAPPFWMTPTAIATSNFPCGKCHDNGPIIRSPYLAQITGPNKLPGVGEHGFNKDQPYYFVGSDFAAWKAYTVEISGNTCNVCHRMGVNNVAVGGTARDFGIRATAASQTNKNPHSVDSPIWMTPSDTDFNQAHANSALAIKACADQFSEGAPLPHSPDCRITQFTGPAAAAVRPGRYTAVWRPDSGDEIQAYGLSYADYRNRYDPLWPLGWRLHSLKPHVENGAVLYDAVWRKSTEGETQVYGWTSADYRSQYDTLKAQGWRLKILQPYVVNGQVRYTAVWHPGSEDEIQVTGLKYADYRAKYDQLRAQGWRLKILQPYVVGGLALYTAVWQPGTEGEIQVNGLKYADYRAKYDELSQQGWRLKLLQPYKVGTEALYTAVWTPGTGSEIQVNGLSYADYRRKYDELWPQGWRLQILQPH